MMRKYGLAEAPPLVRADDGLISVLRADGTEELRRPSVGPSQ
jgi:hypothetical protein